MLYILRHPKSKFLSVFSIITNINFGFTSLRLSLALLIFSRCYHKALQKSQLEKLLIFCGNINSKEVFNTVHKPRLLSLKSLERVRNWKKAFDSHLECDVSEFVELGLMLHIVNQQEKTKLNFSSEKGFSQPQADPA